MITITKLNKCEFSVKYGFLSKVRVKIELFNMLDLILENKSFSKLDEILASIKINCYLNENKFNYAYASYVLLVSSIKAQYKQIGELSYLEISNLNDLAFKNYPIVRPELFTTQDIQSHIFSPDGKLNKIKDSIIKEIYQAFQPVFVEEVNEMGVRFQHGLQIINFEEAKGRIECLVNNKLQIMRENSLKNAFFEFSKNNSLISFIDINEYNLISKYLRNLNINHTIIKDRKDEIEKITFPLTYADRIDYILHLSFNRSSPDIFFRRNIASGRLNFILKEDNFKCFQILNCTDFFPIVQGIEFVTNSNNEYPHIKQDFSIKIYSIKSFDSNEKVRNIINKVGGEFKVNRLKKHSGEIYFDVENTTLYPFDLKDVLYKLIKDQNDSYCIISLGLYEKFCILGKIPNKIEDVINHLNSILDKLVLISEYEILSLFYNEVIYKKHKYIIDGVVSNNKYKVQKIIDNKEQLYFIDRLFCVNTKIKRKKLKHQFVISNTKELNNEQLGKRAELAFNEFLQEHIHDRKWFAYDVNYIESPSICTIEWLNSNNESFNPYDFCIKLNSIYYYIDVKSTRKSEDTIFYLSINELLKIIETPKNYIIARLSLIEEENEYRGVLINEEFYANFYVVKDATIAIIKESIDKWRDYYQENSIRFTIDHFDKVTPDLLLSEIEEFWEFLPDLEKSDLDCFSTFVDSVFFEELYNKQEGYGGIEGLNEVFNKMKTIRLLSKFKIDYVQYSNVSCFPTSPSDEIPYSIKDNIANMYGLPF